MGTLCVNRTKFVWMLWSVRSASAPVISSPLPLLRWWGNPSCRHGPTSAYTWQSINMCRHTKNMSFDFIYQKTKKLNNSKIKSGFGIHYLCLHKPLLVVGACMDHHKSQSLHRDNHIWWWDVSATMERTLLGRGYPPFHLPVCAWHYPSVVDLDTKLRVEKCIL